MNEEHTLELVHGSGNVFRDFDDPDADLKQAKAIVAARVIAALDETGLTVRKAAKLTGFAAADFSRVRNANLGRFTLDRLMRMLSAVDAHTSVTVHVGRDVPLSGPSGGPLQHSTTARRSIIVDKSYAQGARSLKALLKDWDMVFPDAFFFEVASTDTRARKKCLKEIRQLHASAGVHVAPNVGELLRQEIQGLDCAGAPSDNLIRGLKREGFLGMSFEDLSRARRDALRQTDRDFALNVDQLVIRANMLSASLPGTCEGTTKQRKEAYRKARATIAQDRDFVAGFFADFVCRAPDAPPEAPLLERIARSDVFGPAWTIFRWVQVQLLYCLKILERHGRLDPNNLQPPLRGRLQHDVIDMEYLVLGVLQGALATNDNTMRDMFTLLAPDGTVLPPVPPAR